jgi:hypothetical protein
MTIQPNAPGTLRSLITAHIDLCVIAMEGSICLTAIDVDLLSDSKRRGAICCRPIGGLLPSAVFRREAKNGLNDQKSFVHLILGIS